MALEPDVLSRESADIDHAEEIGLPRLDGDCEVLRLVEEGGLGHRLCTGRVAFRIEGREHDGHFLVIPVRDCEDDLFVILAQERRFRVVDYQWSSQPVWVLPSCVRVVPVGARLVDLQEVSWMLPISIQHRAVIILQ